MGIKIEVQNREIFKRHKNFVVISNHQHNMDIIVASHATPKGCVSLGKKSIKWVPLFGQFYWLSGNILIDRSNKRKALASMNLIKEKLTDPDSNMSIWIMPEGTRSKGRGILPFKKGAFITALNTGLPIIPVAISTFENSIDLNKWSPGTIKVKVLEPIPTAGLSKEDLPELIEKCRNLMIQNVNELDKSLS
jgi:1-acyl-sn-glycerol-3-phosphate acyltransferase